MATKKKRTSYPPEYRQRILDLYRAGRSITQLAAEFEPSGETIRLWVRQAELDSGQRKDGVTTTEREELVKLRRENRILREEKEILKKAAAWFAAEAGSPRTRHSNS